MFPSMRTQCPVVKYLSIGDLVQLASKYPPCPVFGVPAAGEPKRAGLARFATRSGSFLC